VNIVRNEIGTMRSTIHTMEGTNKNLQTNNVAKEKKCRIRGTEYPLIDRAESLLYNGNALGL
jgi:hypothetical protein